MKGAKTNGAALPLGEAFAQAMAAYEQGRAPEARRLATRLAQAAPGFGGAHYLLGLIALDHGQGKEAVRHLTRAAEITPGQTVLHLALARAHAAADQPVQAQAQFRAVLTREPGHADAHAGLAGLVEGEEAVTHARAAVTAKPDHAEGWHALGLALQRLDRHAEALEALRRAVGLRPHWPAALNNFGVALKEAGRPEEAAAILAAAVELRPGHAPSRANLAAALRALGRLTEARAQADKATRLDKTNGDAWLELGLALAGDDAGAAKAFERAAAASPASARAWFCLGEARRRLGDLPGARKAYARCLELDPDDRHGAALGAALAAGGPAPAKAPEAYVRQLFDDYAETFDKALVEGLDYRAPALLAQALTEILGRPHGLSVLDAGCGTGLAAPVLRPLATRLDGVDLSPAMVEKARARGLYDALRVGELVADLNAAPAAYDLVVAADVLVYVGALEPVLAAARTALKPGGALAFTVEKTDDTPQGFVLGTKQRYAHCRPYVLATAEQAGFRVALLRDAVTRRDSGADVPGMVAVLTVDE